MSLSLHPLLQEILEVAFDEIPSYSVRREFYKRIIEAFESCADEEDITSTLIDFAATDKALKAAISEIHPDWEI